MLTSELDYDLPPELIAQHPVVPRDRSRLMVYNRRTGVVEHRHLPEILSYLSTGDVMVYNDSRVLKARVYARKPTGGRVELLFLRKQRREVWEALVKPSARLRAGTELVPEAGPPGSAAADGATVTFVLREHLGEGRWLLENRSGVKTEALLEEIGEMPLPPYIKEELKEPSRYQTIYARAPGSAAAPTAGLHFTPELVEGIRESGVELKPLTLHIGLDTFRPIDEQSIELHQIHRESYRLPVGTFEAVAAAKERGGRVMAVGTTSVRVLETVFAEPGGQLEGETDLYITPGYRFKAADTLLTNFHLPRSTLLALVMAFTGVDETRRLYREAISEKYRFYSFGDALLVL